jgi:thymidylate synthase
VLEKQLLREPYSFPKICVKNAHDKIEDYSLDDIEFVEPYRFHETLKMDMVA